jgi:hypothetical protein
MLTAEQFKIGDSHSHIVHRFNAWDYNSMGLKIGEIIECRLCDKSDMIIEQYVEQCRLKGFDHSIVRIDCNDFATRSLFSKLGFTNVETTYEISCRAKNLKNLNTRSMKNKTIMESCNLNDLKKLSHDIFEHGRFAEDFNIGRELSNKRNSYWVSQLYEEGHPRKFLFNKGELIGFMFYKQEGENVRLILGGVSPRYSHVALKFWSQVFSNISEDQTIHTSISANNLGVVNLYSHFGFKFNNSLVGYHKKWSPNES